MVKLKRGDEVTVRMNRGPDRSGTYQKSDITGPQGEWLVIKPLGVRGDAQNFRVRRSCVTPV